VFNGGNWRRFCVQALVCAIASTQVMKAQQVVKAENGDEVSSSLVLDIWDVRTHSTQMMHGGGRNKAGSESVSGLQKSHAHDQ